MGRWSKRPWSCINECCKERRAGEPVSGEGRRGSAGEKVMAALGDTELMWHHPRTAKGREVGAQGWLQEREGTWSGKEDAGGLSESPDKDRFSEGKGNG